MGLLTPSLWNLVPGYGVYLLVEAVVGIISGGSNTTPAPSPPQQRPTPTQPTTQLMTIGDIGWTQKTASHKVYDVNTSRYNTMREEVQNALRISDVSERQRYFTQTRRFDPLIVYHDDEAGYLSIDNRRLAIYTLSLPANSRMPVQVVTRAEAARIIADRLNRGRVEHGYRELTPDEAIQRRYSTRNHGRSINITGDHGRLTVSRSDGYLRTPYMTLEIPGGSSSRSRRGLPVIQSHPELKLTRGKTVSLQKALETNGAIVITTNVDLKSKDDSNFNLLSAEGDTILQIRFSSEAGMALGADYRSKSFEAKQVTFKGIFTKKNAKIVVINRGEYFHVLVNFQTVCYFKKPFEKKAASVRYRFKEGSKNFCFDEVVKLKIYDDYDDLAVENSLLAD